MTEQCPVCQTMVPDGQMVCPTCGFKLIGTTQKFQPLPVEGENESSEHGGAWEGVLTVVRGPQTGVQYRLTEEVQDIGRSPRCSIFLNDMTVSRKHATITRADDCYIIQDDHSFNGVWVNNKTVASKVLEPGDYIQIGSFCFKYEEKDVPKDDNDVEEAIASLHNDKEG